MALGTRTLNGQKLADDYAGLPRDLTTELPTESDAILKAVFCLPTATKNAAKHPTKKHRSKAFKICLTVFFSRELYVDLF